MEINKDIINFETMSFTDRMNYRAHLAAMMDTIDKINKTKPEPKTDKWIDEDNDEYDSFSDGEDSSRGEGDWDDSNEY